MSSMRPSPAQTEYVDQEFRARVARALTSAATVLAVERNPRLAESVPHSYVDKYALSEHVCNTGLAAALSVLEFTTALDTATLQAMRGWVRGGQSATLRLRASEECAFDREEKREEESLTQHELKIGPFKRIDKTVTTITEYFWRFTFSWELVAFPGNQADKAVVLKKRNGKHEIKTLAKATPRPVSTVKPAVDLNVTWLLQQIGADHDAFAFAILRGDPKCRTPRRNPEVERAFAFFSELQMWASQLRGYFLEDLFAAETHAFDLSKLAEGAAVFVPVVPLFEEKKDDSAEAASGGAAAALSASHTGPAIVKTREEGGFGMLRSTAKKMPEQVLIKVSSKAAVETAPLLVAADMELLLGEQKRALNAKATEVATVFPENGKVVSVVEAKVVLGAVHAVEVAQHLFGSLGYIEDMLRKQLIAAIGKEVMPVDFANYMIFHNRKMFRDQYIPRPFCYAVRRPDHYPEGVLSIEALLSDGSAAQPIHTIVCRNEARTPLTFALNASASVSFSGEVLLHGWLQHNFSGLSGVSLRLNARARQFSSFLVLVGRITGPGLFDPQFGLIVKNKDDINIPLDLETIPSAKQFKEAISSLSPEQQAFAKAFRGMQLSSTLFGVCVLQVKPQMERLLKLQDDALTKEIRMTQNLMQLFMQYQIPSDLLSFGGFPHVDRDGRVTEVKHHIKAMQDMIDSMRANELQSRAQEAVFSLADAGIVLNDEESMSSQSEADEEERAAPVSGLFRFKSPRGGKVFQDKAMVETKEEEMPKMRSVEKKAQEPSAPKQSSAPTERSDAPKEPSTASPNEGAAVVPVQSDLVDYTQLPKALDAAFESLDADGAVRPTIVNVGAVWTKSSRAGLLDEPTTSALVADDQKIERQRCYDLLDALTKSGGLAITDATLHIVMVASHCFDKSVLRTLVEDNVNPIERVESSSLIMASQIHGVPVAELVRPEVLDRVKAVNGHLFADAPEALVDL